MSDTLIIGISTGVAVPLLIPVLKWFLDRKNQNLEEINKNLNDISIKVGNLKCTLDATAEGTKGILRYRLIRDMASAIHRGYTTLKEVEEINNLYDAYKNLKGNSTVDKLHDEFSRLEIKE